MYNSVVCRYISMQFQVFLRVSIVILINGTVYARYPTSGNECQVPNGNILAIGNSLTVN